MNRVDVEKEAAKLYGLLPDEGALLSKAEEADIAVLTALIAKFGSTGSAGARHDALRGGCNAILQRKLNKQLIDTMVRLDKSANFLACVGIAVGVIIGVAQIVLPLSCKPDRSHACGGEPWPETQSGPTQERPSGDEVRTKN